MKIPCFVIHFNRPAFLQKCVDALGVDERLQIIVVDNASSSAALNRFQNAHKAQIVRLRQNYGHTVPWEPIFQNYVAGKFGIDFSQPYIVTDCDIVVPERTPWLDVLLEGLGREALAKYNKFGLGLNITSIPAWYPQRAEVIRHETEVVYRRRINDDQFIEMPVDTTLALHRGGYNKYSTWGNDSPFQWTGECLSLRTQAPYEATHLTWHMTKEELAGAEHMNYRKTTKPNSAYWSVK
jgi:hypothetical protein